jgi:hypothetical protein
MNLSLRLAGILGVCVSLVPIALPVNAGTAKRNSSPTTSPIAGKVICGPSKASPKVCVRLISGGLPVNAGTAKPSSSPTATKVICGPSKAFPNAIDVETDRDKDGMPDDFAKAYANLLIQMNSIPFGTDDKIKKIMLSFSSRLPYSKETRALGPKTWELMFEKYGHAKSEKERAQLDAQFAAIQQQTMQDPCYDKIMNAFEVTGYELTIDE